MRPGLVSSGSIRVAIDLPETRPERMRGLVGRASGRGLLLRRTRSVHTFGMRRPIDAVLLDGDDVVVAVVALAPRRILLPRRRVRHVLELFGSPFRAGDVLTIEGAP
jgi:uncharacterized membrane protein (UPF0127 family)